MFLLDIWTHGDTVIHDFAISFDIMVCPNPNPNLMPRPNITVAAICCVWLVQGSNVAFLILSSTEVYMYMSNVLHHQDLY
jgi:hypothetical protein